MADVQDERRALADHIAVHINMMRGVIAKPSVENIIHLYGRDVLLAALREPSGYRAGAEAVLTADQARLLADLIEPLARHNRAIGDAPGPFRFETGTGYRDLSREDLRSAGEASRILRSALTPEAGQAEGGEHA